MKTKEVLENIQKTTTTPSISQQESQSPQEDKAKKKSPSPAPTPNQQLSSQLTTDNRPPTVPRVPKDTSNNSHLKERTTSTFLDVYNNNKGYQLNIAMLEKVAMLQYIGFISYQLKSL